MGKGRIFTSAGQSKGVVRVVEQTEEKAEARDEATCRLTSFGVGPQGERFTLLNITLRSWRCYSANFVFISLLRSLASWSIAQQYGVDKKLLKPDYDGISIRVYDVASGKTQWKGNISPELMAWSKDKKAIAIVEDKRGSWKNSWDYRLRVWRSGKPAKIFDDIPPLHSVAIERMVWSPDDQRLMLTTAASGGSDDTRKTQHFTSGAAGAEWVDARRLKVFVSITVLYMRYMQKHPKFKGLLPSGPSDDSIVVCQ